MDTILHIGLPKTATTHLQRWLDVNAGAIASEVGVLPSQGGGHLLATLSCDQERFSDRADFLAISSRTKQADLRANLDTLRRLNRPIVVSSEYFFLADPAAIKTLAVENGLNISKVICVFRRQDRLIASGYAQDVKMMGRSDAIRSVGYTETYDWNLLSNRYVEVFPGAEFVSLEFDRLRREASLIDHWKRELGVSDLATRDSVSSGKLVNESLPAEMVELCRVANELKLGSFSELAFLAARKGIVSKQYQLPPSLQREVRDAFAVSNDRFVKGLKDPSPFDEYTSSGWGAPGSEDSNNPNGLSLVAVAKLLALAMEEAKERHD